MTSFQLQKDFPSTLIESSPELSLNAIHFSNQILIQIRLDSELDSAYEVTEQGLAEMEGVNSELGYTNNVEESNDDTQLANDDLSTYHIVGKLGDPDNSKLKVVCSQIAKLYNTVIIPNLGMEKCPILISISSKLALENAK